MSGRPGEASLSPRSRWQYNELSMQEVKQSYASDPSSTLTSSGTSGEVVTLAGVGGAFEPIVRPDVPTPRTFGPKRDDVCQPCLALCQGFFGLGCHEPCCKSGDHTDWHSCKKHNLAQAVDELNERSVMSREARLKQRKGEFANLSAVASRELKCSEVAQVFKDVG